MIKLNILLPLYNDWRSCNLLIKKINGKLENTKLKAKIIILNDASTQKISINKKNLKKISKIKVITSNINLGSQKIISVGLHYLKKIKNETVIVMDSDGEDDFNEIIRLINKSNKYKNFVVAATRAKRRESLIFKLLYKLHLSLAFVFTLNWISFGNFTCFNSKNIKSILKNNYSWLAFSSCILKNCKVIRLSSERKKRFFGKSKLSFLGLFYHSFRVLSVFQLKIFVMSLIYILFLFIFTYKSIFLFILIIFIILLNFLIFYTKKQNKKNFHSDKTKYIDSVKIIK